MAYEPNKGNVFSDLSSVLPYGISTANGACRFRRAVIPADAWNELRDKVCNDTKISDDTTVYFDYLIINGEVDRFCYVTVGDWRTGKRYRKTGSK